MTDFTMDPEAYKRFISVRKFGDKRSSKSFEVIGVMPHAGFLSVCGSRLYLAHENHPLKWLNMETAEWEIA